MELICGDSKEKLLDIPDNSIEHIITDPPYEKTNNKWDILFPLDTMWSEFKRILIPRGNVIITSIEPFTSKLIMSNPDWFRYDVIWRKTIGSGQLNINIRPLKIHENILVFYEKFKTYNEQLIEGTPYTRQRNNSKYNTNYNSQIDHTAVNSGTRRPKSIIEIVNRRYMGGHPTQKPIRLMGYLIRTYSNEGDTILDPFMGNGSTGCAALSLRRNFLGIEKDPEWFASAKKRLEKHTNQEKLF